MNDIDQILIGMPNPHISAGKIIEEIEMEYEEISRKIEKILKKNIYEYFSSFMSEENEERMEKLRFFVEKIVGDIFEPERFAKQYIKQDF